MKNLETCDWMLLNSIIYKIYTTEDLDEMRREFLEQLRLVVDFDSADFYLAGHNEKDEMAQPVAYNCEVQDKVDYEQYEYCRRVIEGWEEPCVPTYRYDSGRRMAADKIVSGSIPEK